MVLYKYTVFDVECPSSGIARYRSQQAASVRHAKIFPAAWQDISIGQ